MTELNEAPWFDALSDADKAAYVQTHGKLVEDLHAAADFMRELEHMVQFPVRSYQPEVDLQYFVNNEADADPKGDFERIAANVLAAGGVTFDRTDIDSNGVQHIAELYFGSGRVAYRAVWIERTPTNE